MFSPPSFEKVTNPANPAKSSLPLLATALNNCSWNYYFLILLKFYLPQKTVQLGFSPFWYGLRRTLEYKGFIVNSDPQSNEEYILK